MSKQVNRSATTAAGAQQSKPPSCSGLGIALVHDGHRVIYKPVEVTRPVRVGRSEDADLQLDDAMSSRLHACLSLHSGALVIEDLQSAHGVWVSGERVRDQRNLAPGDVVRLGQTLLVVIERAAEQAAVEETTTTATLVGARSARAAIEFAGRFGPTNLSVLLLGETGTGKDVVAQAVHQHSNRPGRFVAVNCSTLPKTLADSQLFGHRKGAFSGAARDQTGLFTAADGGTLFLDELGDLDSGVQAKLLRALETGEILPLGATETTKVDIRLVAATSYELSRLVAEGRFRRDLYHRIRAVCHWLPPLRERNEEIALLCQHFSSIGLTSAALEALLVYPWPGNVRELKQVLRAAEIRARDRGADTIQLEDLALDVAQHEDTVAALSLERVVSTLKHRKGNVSKVAEDLGVHRAQIYRLLKSHGLSSAQFRD